MPIWPGRWGLPQATPPLEHGGKASAASAEPRERGRNGHPKAPGDFAHPLALADENQHPALPGLHQPEQLQQSARLDLPVGRRHPAGDVGQWTRDGDLPAAAGLLVVRPSLVGEEGPPASSQWRSGWA